MKYSPDIPVFISSSFSLPAALIMNSHLSVHKIDVCHNRENAFYDDRKNMAYILILDCVQIAMALKTMVFHSPLPSV